MKRYDKVWLTCIDDDLICRIGEVSDGRYVLFDDAQAEIDALKAERDELRSALKGLHDVATSFFPSDERWEKSWERCREALEDSK